MRNVIIIALLISGLSASGQAINTNASILTKGPSGALGWNTGNHTQYIRGDGYLDTRVILISGVATPASPGTGSTAEQNLLNIMIPDSVCTTNSLMRITVSWVYTGLAGSKTPTIRVDTISTGTTGTAICNNSINGATSLVGTSNVNFWNRNSYTSQISTNPGTFNGGAGSPVTTSINTQVHFYFHINIVMGNANDTYQIVGICVELLNP